jgi:arsenite methyltransferase
MGGQGVRRALEGASAGEAATQQTVILSSDGSGSPSALAHVRPGETVLDLGSGGSIDVLLTAVRVGPSGKTYGLESTDALRELARENQRRAGLSNVEFLKGGIEDIPLPDNSVDVVMSNLVVNLSPENTRVLWEAFRVLRPGGRMAIADIVVVGDVPTEIRRCVEVWLGSIRGALEEKEYRVRLAQAGFEAIDIVPTRLYRAEDAREFLLAADFNYDHVAPLIDGKFLSAFIRARKPQAAQAAKP